MPPVAPSPVLLMPVRLETKFVTLKNSAEDKETHKYQLWLRIFPDEIFLNNFDPILSEDEIADKKRYAPKLIKKKVVQDIDDNDRKSIWNTLVKKYGVYRASWILHSSEKNQKDLSSHAQEYSPYYSWLPDYFTIYLYTSGGQSHAYKKKLKNVENPDRLEVLGGNMNWLQDFSCAVEVGLACKIDLGSSPPSKIKKVIAVGIKRGSVKGTSKSELDKNKDSADKLVNEHIKELILSHQYTNGFSFLEYGTPTNNTENVKSAFSANDRYVAIESFEYVVDGYNLDKEKSTIRSQIATDIKNNNGFKEFLEAVQNANIPLEKANNYASSLAYATGLDLNDFNHIKGATLSDPLLNHLVQKATWFAMGEETISRLFGDNIDNKQICELWGFYHKYVRNRGPLPCIQIGKLPYGILPVKKIRKDYFPTSSIGKRSHSLTKLFKLWLLIVDKYTLGSYPPENSYLNLFFNLVSASNNTDTQGIPHLNSQTKDINEELAKILSMGPVSNWLQIRTLALKRMRNLLPRRFENKSVLQVPQSLFSFSPKLVGDLLGGFPDYKRNFDKAIRESTLLRIVFGGLKEEHILHNNSAFAFTNAGVVNIDSLDIPITLKENWHSNEFSSLVAHRLRQEKELFYYTGKTDFLLFDLLERSYHRARARFNRNIKANFNKSDIKGVATLQPYVLKGLGPVEQGEVVMKLKKVYSNEIGNSVTNNEISIKAPFKGEISAINVEENVPLDDDKILFRLKDQSNFDDITKKMVSLQAQIILEIERLKVEGKDYIAAQKTALLEALDLNSFRLDAWITGLAQEQLEKQRAEGVQETRIGAYGWLEDLERDENNEVIYSEKKGLTQSETVNKQIDSGGIIHAPSSAQAITAAMFRQEFSIHQADFELGNPYTLNLTSDRIQKAMQFMDGLRQGQSMEALLGYRFERFLREEGEHALIYKLRRLFPLKVNKMQADEKEAVGIPILTVINALSLKKKYREENSFTNDENKVIRSGIDIIDNILDGSADVLLFESGHEMINGNFTRAAAAQDAAKGKQLPPDLSALKTKITGSAQSHHLLLLFERPGVNPTIPGNNPRLFVEPTLEHWLRMLIGDLDKIAVKVHIRKGDTLKTFVVTVASLWLGYQDLLHLTPASLKDDASELAQRILYSIKLPYTKIKEQNIEYTFDNTVPAGKVGLMDVIERLQSLRVFLSNTQSIQMENLRLGHTLQDETESQALKDAIEVLKSKLLKCCNQLINDETPPLILSKYEVERAKSMFYGLNQEVREQAGAEAKGLGQECKELLNNLDDRKSYLDSIKKLKDIAKKLFGESFQLIIPCIMPNSFKLAMKREQALMVGTHSLVFDNKFTGGEERIRHWLEGRAEVSPQSEAFSDFLMMFEYWGGTNPSNLINSYLENWQFSIAQETDVGLMPWVALDEHEMGKIRNLPIYQSHSSVLEEKAYPNQAKSIVAYRPNKYDFKQELVYGLYIDHFSETVPNKKVNTGVAFEYDAPSNEAPQALLLAVFDQDYSFENDADGKIEDEAVRDIVNDTLDLLKVRMVDVDALQQLDLRTLPMPIWYNIPNII